VDPYLQVLKLMIQDS